MTTPEIARKVPRGTWLLSVLFVVYLVLLAWLILWKFEIPWHGDGSLRIVKVVPFVEAGGVAAGTPREALANVVFFIPFGVVLSLLAPRLRWWSVSLVAAACSAVFETCQYVFAIGATDVTDVITNAAGALIGFGVLALLHHLLGERTRRVMLWVCTICTVLAVAAATFFLASPIHFSQHQGTTDRASVTELNGD